jgi:hypothetical protein
MTPAQVTDNNADAVARGAFQGGDLGASAAIPLAPQRSDAAQPAPAGPKALTLVRLLSEVSSVLPPSPSIARAPVPRAVIVVDNTIQDGMGGSIHYTLTVDDQTGAFSGMFTFMDFHGEEGGVITGLVAVSGGVQGQDIGGIHFDFQSVRIVDGAEDVTAFGTVDLVPGAGGVNATLDIFFTDNLTHKTVWLANFTVEATDGLDFTEVRMSGRVYLHDYGYVDVHTEAGFIYPVGSSTPASGAMTVTGRNGSRARLTADGQTQYTLEVDADGNGSYEWTIVHSW